MNFDVISPKNTDELLKAVQENQGRNFRFGAGYTDLIPELQIRPEENLTVINLVNLKDQTFTSIESTADGVRVGSLVTAGAIVADNYLEMQFPVLWKAAIALASRQIRQVATVGGNLCTASPAGDLSCALVALRARCEILSTHKSLQTIPVEDFFAGVKKTALRKDEILRSVFIPANTHRENICSDFIKVGTRQSMEIATVALAYHLLTDSDNRITQAGVAIGSVAPTIHFAKTACDYLNGKCFSAITSAESEEFAMKVLDYAAPISDHRASKWYREKVLFNISKSIFSC